MFLLSSTLYELMRKVYETPLRVHRHKKFSPTRNVHHIARTIPQPFALPRVYTPRKGSRDDSPRPLYDLHDRQDHIQSRCHCRQKHVRLAERMFVQDVLSSQPTGGFPQSGHSSLPSRSMQDVKAYPVLLFS